MKRIRADIRVGTMVCGIESATGRCSWTKTEPWWRRRYSLSQALRLHEAHRLDQHQEGR